MSSPDRPEADFDVGALAAWLLDAAPQVGRVAAVRRFAGGQSNPTYAVEASGGRFVLRRKPFGALLPSAHAVEREYRVISCLHRAGFPVPQPQALCEDASVIGSSFYVMSLADGRLFWDGALPGMAPEERRGLYRSAIATLVHLHSFDPQAIGLGDYGRPGNYVGRQVGRWTRQYRESPVDKLATMDRLADWLAGSIPEQNHVSVVHGDYRIDNMVFHAASHDMLAVLDWELSTLGDPVADFAYFLMNWVTDAEPGRAGLRGLDLAALCIPDLAETCDLYAQLSGRSLPASMDWHLAYNFFRLAAISHGIAGRVLAGTASSADARAAGARFATLAEAGWRHAVAAGA